MSDLYFLAGFLLGMMFVILIERFVDLIKNLWDGRYK